MLKSRAVTLISACTLLIFALMMSACDKGDLKPNQEPVLEFSSYGGADSLAATLNDTTSFQQKIYWNSYDVDGVVTGYAYRILDNQGNPISTPGNEFLVTNTELDLVPIALKRLGGEYEKGWVLHYQTGAPDSIPLSSPNARRTIWTKEVSAIINFPANINGVATDKISAFEIVAIDNRGDISSVKRKYFHVNSTKPTAYASSTKGDLTDAEVGQGLRINFTMIDNDPFIGNIPWYYEYQLYRVKEIPSGDSTIVTDTTDANNILYRSKWFSTKDYDKVNEIVLTKNTNPPLVDNYNPENSPVDTCSTPFAKTFLVVKVIDLAGIRSEPHVYKFHVSGKFYPETLAYLGKCYALGDYHYVEQQDPGSPDILPSIRTSEGIKIARPFFLHPTSFDAIDPTKPFEIIPNAFKMTAMGRKLKTNEDPTDLRVWLKWGYKGEYKNDDPNDIKKYVPRDSSNANYQTEISYFHIQLDGQQYQFAPLLKPGMQTDPDWLRIPASHDIAQKVPLTKLAPGRHVLRIKAEDLQGKCDRTPAEIVFEIVEPKPVNERNGVLVITNEGTSSAVNALTKQFYTDQLNVADSSKFVYRTTWSGRISSIPGSLGKLSNYVFAPSYLQNFKTVIYYHDFMPYQGYNFDNEANAFRLYMRLNGSMILSGGQNITNIHAQMYGLNEKILSDYFGLPNADNCFVIAKLFNPPYNVNAWMTGATTSVAGFPNIDVDVTTNPVSIVNTKKGLGTVSYFKNVAPANVLYRSVLKPVGSAAPAPDSLSFDEMNNQVVAVFKENGKLTGQPRVKSYLFGFPLSLMDRPQAIQLYNAMTDF